MSRGADQNHGLSPEWQRRANHGPGTGYQSANDDGRAKKRLEPYISTRRTIPLTYPEEGVNLRQYADERQSFGQRKKH